MEKRGEYKIKETQLVKLNKLYEKVEKEITKEETNEKKK